MNETTDIGPLAAALAKAQSEFPAINRSKTVTVKTKTGGQYEFSYAPLDKILEATRGPLARNGLSIVQLLDSDSLVTLLLHESGGTLEGRTTIPGTADVQAFGSAITYLRRYAIQALLGIAAEDDDDGNRASGNAAKTKSKGGEDERPPAGEDIPPTDAANETLRPLGPITRVGAITKGSGRHSDLEWRQTPDGYRIGWLLEVGDAKARPQVVVEGPLALRLRETEMLLFKNRKTIEGTRVTVTGDLFEVRVPSRRVVFRIVATDLESPDWELAATAEAASEPMWPDEAEQAAIVAKEYAEAVS